MDKLVESSLELQKISLRLVESNNNLTKKIDSLVSLFEEAARNMSTGGSEQIHALNRKINELVTQNKQLARGLVLMEEKIRKNPPSISARPIPKL